MAEPEKAPTHELIEYNDTHRASILSIWHSSVLATHKFVSPEDILFFKDLVSTIDFTAYDTRVLQIQTEQHRAGPEVVGFLAVTKDQDPPKLEMLFIHPDWMGRGYGTIMTAFAITDLKVQEVDVNEQNGDAVKFYEKMRFTTFAREQKDGTGKDYPILKMRLS